MKSAARGFAADEDLATQIDAPAGASVALLVQPHVAELCARTNGEGERLPLHGRAEEFVVGRGATCNWRLHDHGLSRHHARFFWNGVDLFVEDLASANGTMVNGRPIRERTRVETGQTIALGNVTMTLERAQAAPSATSQLFANAVVQTRLNPRSTADAPLLRMVYRPRQDMADARAMTRPVPLEAALAPLHRPSLYQTFSPHVVRFWVLHRRKFMWAGVLLWSAVLVAVLSSPSLFLWLTGASAEVRPQAVSVENPSVDRSAAPTVRSLEVAPAPNPVARAIPDSVGADEAELGRAIFAYDQGQSDEALLHFRKVAEGRGDDAVVARFMVRLLEERIGQRQRRP